MLVSMDGVITACGPRRAVSRRFISAISDQTARPFTGAGELTRAVGRGFIPGITQPKSTRASAPEVCFSGIPHDIRRFSALRSGRREKISANSPAVPDPKIHQTRLPIPHVPFPLHPMNHALQAAFLLATPGTPPYALLACQKRRFEWL